jgi:centromeric protein E
MEKICVAIRVKPPSIKQESVTKGHEWKVVDKTIALCSAAGTLVSGHSFSFDTIFGTSAKNVDIYEQHAKAVVLSAVAGFNGTVFAYGQTSSGKTYTMRGSQAEPGVTWLAVDDVFRSIQEMSNREFLIRVSYMEIYNEEIKDLLSPDNRKLQIHESLERGVFVAGLREEIVDSVEQVLGLLESGEAQRHFGETNMNMYSSRSHTIFRMVIESRDKSQDDQDSDPDSCASDAVRVSALNLVDLAGSERIAKTGAGGVRLKEGGHINKSLMTLGNVINKLCDGGGKQGGHIPYRDSKLTRILQSALGGNARTAIICTITPDEIHIDETRGTLQFASRAKRVTNCAQVNETVTDAALLKRQKREIEELLQKLQGSPHSEDLEKEIRTLRNDLLQVTVY